VQWPPHSVCPFDLCFILFFPVLFPPQGIFPPYDIGKKARLTRTHRPPRTIQSFFSPGLITFCGQLASLPTASSFFRRPFLSPILRASVSSALYVADLPTRRAGQEITLSSIGSDETGTIRKSRQCWRVCICSIAPFPIFLRTFIFLVV